MQVKCKRTIAFRRTGAKKLTVTVAASKDIQGAPDWIRDTSAFKTATRDGSITEVIYKEVETAKVPEAKKDAPNGNSKK